MTNVIKFVSTLTATLILCISFSSFAAKFEEGKHFSVVADKKTSRPELREYFSYYCPACRAYEPYLAGFKKAMPERAKFNKVHVDFMGQTSADIQFMLGKALIIAEKTGVDSQFSAAIFKYLQTDRATISNEKDIRNVFVLSGGEGRKFDQGMKSFSVISEAKKEKKYKINCQKVANLQAYLQ